MWQNVWKSKKETSWAEEGNWRKERDMEGDRSENGEQRKTTVQQLYGWKKEAARRAVDNAKKVIYKTARKRNERARI